MLCLSGVPEAWTADSGGYGRRLRRKGKEEKTLKRIGIVLLCLILLAGSALGAEAPEGAAEGNAALAGLNPDPETQVLDLDALGLQVTDAQALAQVIDRLPALTEVRLFDSPMATADMEWLFDRYSPRIFFGFSLRIGPHVIRTDQTAFSTLHLAGEMKGDERHTSEELYPLRMCTRLKALDVGHNYLTDVSFLNGLTELEVLIISPNYGLEDISPVANCKKLVYLECFNTPITDLSPLAGLKDLRDLNLTRDSLVTDISPLYDLPNLQRVWWGEMRKVPMDQKKAMREKHKGCKFVMVYDPTSGGWRSHPHYRELHSFFRTGEYIPFSE